MMAIRSAPLWIAKLPAIEGMLRGKRPLNGVRPMMTMDSLLGNFPWQDGALYVGWRAAAQIDRNPELHGLPNFRAFVRQLPEDPHAFLQLALSELGIPGGALSPLLSSIDDAARLGWPFAV